MLSIEILTERKNGNNNEPLLNCLSLTGTSVNLTNKRQEFLHTTIGYLAFLHPLLKINRVTRFSKKKLHISYYCCKKLSFHASS